MEELATQHENTQSTCSQYYENYSIEFLLQASQYALLPKLPNHCHQAEHDSVESLLNSILNDPSSISTPTVEMKKMELEDNTNFELPSLQKNLKFHETELPTQPSDREEIHSKSFLDSGATVETSTENSAGCHDDQNLSILLVPLNCEICAEILNQWTNELAFLERIFHPDEVQVFGNLGEVNNEPIECSQVDVTSICENFDNRAEEDDEKKKGEQSIDEEWLTFFGELQEFKKEHGHTVIPRREFASLSYWASTQRTQYRAGRLSQVQATMLESLGFALVKNPSNKRSCRVKKSLFEKSELKKKEAPVTFPPEATPTKRHLEADEDSLSGLPETSKKPRMDDFFQGSLSNTMVLVDEGFGGFEVQVPHREPQVEELSVTVLQKKVKGSSKSKVAINFWNRWMNNYNKVKEFVERYGSFQMDRTDNMERSLDDWMNRQRMKLKELKLTGEQFQLLEEIGFDWKKRKISRSQPEEYVM